MPKAEIATSTGTKIIIDGSTAEIAAILSIYKDKPNKDPDTSLVKDNHNDDSKRHQKSKLTLEDYILDLKSSGFFDAPKKTALVKEKLDQESHFYPMQTVSTRLIRMNEKKLLGRIKEGNQWAYVKR